MVGRSNFEEIRSDLVILIYFNHLTMGDDALLNCFPYEEAVNTVTKVKW